MYAQTLFASSPTWRAEESDGKRWHSVRSQLESIEPKKMRTRINTAPRMRKGWHSLAVIHPTTLRTNVTTMATTQLRTPAMQCVLSTGINTAEKMERNGTPWRSLSLTTGESSTPGAADTYGINHLQETSVSTDFKPDFFSQMSVTIL